MSQAVHPNDYAIVVGINQYADPNRNLTSPVQDAQRIQSWLLDETGGGLDDENCCTLFGDDQITVTRELIEDELIKARRFSKQRRDAGEVPRRLYFYFSGHGLAKEADAVLMCHARWSADRPNANINSAALEKNYLNCCTWFDEVVVWLDCCRNRSIITKPGGLEVDCAPRPDAALQKTMMAFATLDGSYAFEGLTPADENSVFTEALLQGLRQADNGHGQVTWRSLKAYLEEYVPDIALRQEKAQKPQVDFLRLSTDDDPVFGAAALKTITLEFNKSSGSVTIFNQSLERIIQDHDLSAGPVEFAFPVGRYLAVYGAQQVAFSVAGEQQSVKVEFS